MQAEPSNFVLLRMLIERWEGRLLVARQASVELNEPDATYAEAEADTWGKAVAELMAELAALPPAPPQGLMEKLSESANAWQRAYLDEHGKVMALRAEMDTNVDDLRLEAFLNGYFQKKGDTLAASKPAQEQELVQRIDRSLELGRILGPEYDGATFEEVARELVALKAKLAPPPAQPQEQASKINPRRRGPDEGS